MRPAASVREAGSSSVDMRWVATAWAVPRVPVRLLEVVIANVGVALWGSSSRAAAVLLTMTVARGTTAAVAIALATKDVQSSFTTEPLPVGFVTDESAGAGERRHE
ncbi:hypothetical protein P0W64_10790 [Tsukamurella sp. 8F]|uniref:hypothetical protein n=1 Tax=unclassified Tsukamurella TaxID=2633480 RepID=UPI0023B8C9EE|nr:MULTISPECIES: hypothetical protein [unclassified Tsukamurella]MDF0529970.1 hypothetical protein [Tsukamurella sp. 8J]MDF0587258.1 hypothetical protein [Tsukamurella sp. 8F]